MGLQCAAYYGDENEITVIPCLHFIALDLDFSPAINNILLFWKILSTYVHRTPVARSLVSLHNWSKRLFL